MPPQGALFHLRGQEGPGPPPCHGALCWHIADICSICSCARALSVSLSLYHLRVTDIKVLHL